MRRAVHIVLHYALLLALGFAWAARAEEPADFRELNLQLLDAARAGDEAAVERLLREGASVKTRNRFGATPLLQAAREGHDDVVRTLLKAGAEVDQPNVEQSLNALVGADRVSGLGIGCCLSEAVDP